MKAGAGNGGKRWSAHGVAHVGGPVPGVEDRLCKFAVVEMIPMVGSSQIGQLPERTPAAKRHPWPIVRGD